MTLSARRLALSLLLILAAGAHAQAPAPAGAPPARLAIEGAVREPLSLGVDELRQFPREQIVELQLPAHDGAGQPARLRGVRLRAVLARADIVSADHNTVKKLAIIASARDGYKVVFSWNELFNAELGDAVLVVFERDGHALGPDEGPLALISGKDVRTGPRHVKWLQTVEVRQIVQ